MKQKNFSVYIRFLIRITAVGLTLIFFMACKNQPIFYAIEQEVKLKDFSVKSTIVGFVGIGNDIYTANAESVYTKNSGSTGKWTPFGSPGTLIQGIATDGTHLFAVGVDGTVRFRDNNSDWKAVPGSEKIQMVFGDSVVFGVGSEDNKPAIYKITAASVLNIKELKVEEKNKETVTGAAGNYFVTTEGLFRQDGTAIPVPNIKGKIISASKGKNSGSIFVLTDEAMLYYYNGSGWSEKKVEKAGCSSIFYFAGRNTVLIGSKQGYTEIQLDGEDNLTGAKELQPGVKGSTTPPECLSQYQSVTGSYSITPIFAVGSADEYSLFVGAAAGSTQRNTGLWAFYSTHTKEWNRE
ncbi:hypothetical protein [Treponema pedis]|uniref:hypothetical protein n=1 Tax=Treponema pedis TaxID=409322 RepID=UPI003141D937